MSSEALERALYLLANPASSKWGQLQEILRDARAELAALAVAREREQRAQLEADTFRQAAKFHAREADAAREREQRAVDALRYIAGYDVAGYDAHLDSEDVARAALVDEPAAATLTEPGIGESLADESPRNTDAGRSELAARSLHAPGSASAAADDGRCPGCGWYVADCNCGARAAADEPGETP